MTFIRLAWWTVRFLASLFAISERNRNAIMRDHGTFDDMSSDNCLNSLPNISTKKECTENLAGKIMGGSVKEVPDANKQ